MAIVLQNALILSIVMFGSCTDSIHACYKYFVTFIDDYSRFTWVYFLRSKFEVFTVFKLYVAYVKTQFSTGIKVL